MTLPPKWKDAAFWVSVVVAGIGSALLQPDYAPIWKYVGAALVAMLPLIFAGVRHKDNAAKIEQHSEDIQQIKQQ